MGSNSPGQSICLRHELVSDISMESCSLYTPVQHRSFWVLVPGDRNHGSFHLQYGLLLTAGRTLLALSRSILETGGGGVQLTWYSVATTTQSSLTGLPSYAKPLREPLSAMFNKWAETKNEGMQTFLKPKLSPKSILQYYLLQNVWPHR